MIGHTTSTKPRHRIEEIEVLRALAIIITFVHHTFFYLLLWQDGLRNQVYSYFTFWSGVDVFFAISGFVIAKDFFARQRSRSASYWRISGAFWIRRAFRILPSAWFWLLMFLAGTLFWNTSAAFGSFGASMRDSLAAVLQVANLHQALCAHGKAVCGVNGVYWSLSLEEQFYLFLPLLIFVSRKYLPYVLTLGWLAQFFVARPEWTFAWAFRTDGFILGVLLALWSQKESYLNWAPAFLARFFVWRWLCGILLILAVVTIPAPPHHIPWATSWLSVVCICLVWIASYGKGYLMKPSRLRKILVWLGTRSYAIYLIHLFVIRLTLEIFYRSFANGEAFHPNSLALLTCAIFLTLVFSELNYRLLEQPLRLMGRRLSEKFLQPQDVSG